MHSVSTRALGSASSRWPVDRGRVELRLLEGMPVDAERHQFTARTLWLEPGRWRPPPIEVPGGYDGWLGMLILNGLVVRQIHAGGMRCCELLGPGDVFRPWDEGDDAGPVESFGAWRVLEPTRLALLDAEFARTANESPGVTGELLRRGLARSQALGVLLALTHARRADVRLRTLFWHLADRWGQVTPDGAVLPLHLTHSLIAQLTGLRRPSVSVTLGELSRSGEIRRIDKGNWLISPPR